MKRLVAIGVASMLLATTCVMPEMQTEASELVEDENINEVVEIENEDATDAKQTVEKVESEEDRIDLIEEEAVLNPVLSYSTHVQKIGWQKPVLDGQIAGTEGKSLRMEAVKIELQGVPEGKGGIEYAAHVQKIGWQNFVNAGQLAGTEGRSLRVEAFKIRLTGELAEQYDVYYRTHIQSYGWLGWAKNGEGSGSMGLSKRMEALQIKLVKKGDAAPDSEGKAPYVFQRVAYQAHSQTYGWVSTVYDGADGGVIGKSKRLEALKISLPEQEYDGNIMYRAFIQGIGWQTWKQNGEEIGTVGSSKRIEAIEVKLDGELAEHYSVYYSVHMAKIGWTDYAKDGETAGSSELSKRIEAVRIKLVKDGEEAPSTSGIKYIRGLTSDEFYYKGIIQGQGESENITNGNTLGSIGEGKRLESLTFFVDNENEYAPKGDVKYSTYVSEKGWQTESTTGDMNGCEDGTVGIEAVKVSLVGELANYYDVYYRAHVQKYGWLGWAKNGQAAGTATQGYRMEALQVKLVSKDSSAPGENSNYYTEKKYRKYQNPSQYYQIKDHITLSGGGYNLIAGCEGIKVRKVIQRLGLGNGVGMGGAYYGTTVQNAVRNFQKNNNLLVTGIVDLSTWKKLGFTEVEWYAYGEYVSPIRVNENSTKAQHIEAMISRAYDYLGNDYVIGASGAPGLGIDCSGLVMQALYAAGLDTSPINPVSHAQPGHEYESRNMWSSSKFMHVPYSQRQRGDLIFYQSSSGVVIHVAIYLGNDTVIEAWPNKVVVWPIRNASRANIKGVVRPFV